MGGGRSAFTVDRANAAPPYVVSVRPLVATDRVAEYAVDAAAIIFVNDPLRGGGLDAQLLRGVFGLTGAEADLAIALQSGTPVTDYARARSLSLNTVYTHLRRLKEKTGTTRLPELIGKLNALRSTVR
jgi:DNA-binding CsgD family transcriptional regulator